MRGAADTAPVPASPPPSPSSLNVLVVGSEDWSVARASSELRAAGVTVLRCNDSVEDPFPCNAVLPGRSCPLDAGRVDVILAVRGRPRSAITLGEMGAICGLRARIPVVTAGLYEASGLERWATPVGDEDIVIACQRAAGRMEGTTA